MHARSLILLFFCTLALVACQAAAAPTAETVVETVVVTELVEGETVEVVVTATSAPSVEVVVDDAFVPVRPATAQAQARQQEQVDAASVSPLAFVIPSDRLVIKDAEIELLVSSTDTTLANITQLASDYGGYIISGRTWYVDGYKHASVRLAVPSDTFEPALNTLRIFGDDVLSETASGQDVTAEYVDLDSRLANLEATAARVREFLAAAETVDESLKVSAELAELDQQIEQIKGQMRYIEGRAAFSTVTVLLTPDRPTPTPTATATATPTATPTAAWSAGKTFEEASGTLVDLSQGTADILIWTVVIAGPFAGVLLLIVWGLRRRPGKPRPAEPQTGD